MDCWGYCIAPRILRNCTPTWYNFRCPKNSRNSFSDSSRSEKFKIKASASLHCPEAVRESPPLPLPGSGGPRYSLVVATWLHLASVFTQPSPLSSVSLSSVWHLSWDLGLTQVTLSFIAQPVKNLPLMQETPVWFLGGKGLLEKEMAAHSIILSWRILWTEKLSGLQSMGHKSWTQLSD